MFLGGKFLNNITLFDVQSTNDEMVEAFYDFFENQNLMPLFTNQHRTDHIKVTDLDVRSTIKYPNSYNRLLKSFSSFVNMNQNNIRYEESVFEIIDNAKTFQKLMNNIRDFLNYQQTINDEHTFNLWNIVYYDDVGY